MTSWILVYSFIVKNAEHCMSTFDEDDIKEAIAEKCGTEYENVDLDFDEEEDEDSEGEE